VSTLEQLLTGAGYLPYSVDRFTGTMVSANEIAGTCTDERFIQGTFRLHRLDASEQSDGRSSRVNPMANK
jgi:hypothetical protein